MPTSTKTFTYTGTVNELVIPAGTTTIDIYLWGGAGGGGGNDRHAGGPGSAGHFVKKTSYSVASNIGDTLQVVVGGGGGGGSSGGGAPGGTNGKSLEDYSGGEGGNAGPQPYSGGGGAGGGATVIIINGTAVAIAGGGGGGGGGGNHSGGGTGINTNTATARTPGTLGENGADHTGDGGGGGAGGGGADGGTGGSGGSGDNGGAAGKAGSNLVPAGGSEDDGSGTAPGGTGEGVYQSGVAVGPGNSSAGANGLAVIVIDVGVQASVRVGGAWKDVSNIYAKVSGAWKEITAAYTRVGGYWKDMFNSGINFTSTSAGFGNPEGNLTSGAAGSGGGCFLAGTLITMADGSQKPVEQVDLKDKVAVGGFVFATGKFLVEDLHDYKGIKVSGSHMVKEDGKWCRVADSKLGVALGDDEHVVYIFGSEYRRIIINGIEFTDYFEIDEKQYLLNNGEKFFGIWREYDRQTLDNSAKILNDG